VDRRKLIPLLLVAAAFSGCGGGTKTVTVGSASTTQQTLSDDASCTGGTDSANGAPCTPPPSASATSTTSADTGPPQCTSQDSRAFVGKCIAGNGSTFIFANRGSSVRLKTMRVKVVNVDTPQSVSSGSGFTANAHGTFVIVTIAVTNTTSSPQAFDEGSSTSQAELVIGKNTYSVSFDAENTNDPNSFVTNSNDIQPGETRTGTVDFDVPSSSAKRVYDHGALIVTDFGEGLDTAQTAAALKFFHP
jgi:Domain of unknown function (DUF4352)